MQLHPETAIVNNLIEEGLLRKDFDYLHIREQVKWKHSCMENLLTAFLQVPLSPILHRNQIRVYRLLNVVRNRLPHDMQDRFSYIAHRNMELAIEMNEENYRTVNQCLQMAVNGATVNQIYNICKEIDFEKYENEYENMKMHLEVKFERARKYLQ